jgi:hypothetical protein
MAALLEPKEITVKTQSGVEKTFIISKFPAIAGREIITKYPVSNMPKVGDYSVSEETMLKLMAFVAVPIADATPQPLSNRALVDNHIPDWETLCKIEAAMLEYNCSFFGNGLALNFFQGIAQKAQALITQTLTDLSAQSSAKEKQL